MKTIREFIYRLLLRRRKRMALFEVLQDIQYIEKFKGGMLTYDESKARKKMAELKAKETRTPQEDAELDSVLDVISESKAVKNEHRMSAKLAQDLINYNSLL